MPRMEKAMAPHSSTLAWRIPWMEEPGRLQSMGSLGVGHDWVTSLSLFTFMHWRRKRQPTPVFLPGETQGRGAWWAAISGVAQSWTRLKRLSSSSSRGLPKEFVGWNTITPRNFINWSCKLTLYQREWDGGGGQPPEKSEVRAQSSKVGRLWFFGGRCSRIFRGTPKARSRLCVCRAYFLMTFAMSGVPLASSRQCILYVKLYTQIIMCKTCFCLIILPISWILHFRGLTMPKNAQTTTQLHSSHTLVK